MKLVCHTKKVGTSTRTTGFERRLKLAANGLIWLNICQEKKVYRAQEIWVFFFIECLGRGGVGNNDG